MVLLSITHWCTRANRRTSESSLDASSHLGDVCRSERENLITVEVINFQNANSALTIGASTSIVLTVRANFEKRMLKVKMNWKKNLCSTELETAFVWLPMTVYRKHIYSECHWTLAHPHKTRGIINIRARFNVIYPMSGFKKLLDC